MAKLPGFMFYPGDWQKEPTLRRCSHAAKGVYMDILCLMFECEDRGVLATAGRGWSEDEVALAVGGDYQQSLSCVRELVEKGVISWNNSGCMYSRRMVRDEEKRKLFSEAGRKGGGNPQFRKGSPKGDNKGPPKGPPEKESENEPETEVVEAWNLVDGNRKVRLPLNQDRTKRVRARMNEKAWRENWRAALSKFPLKCFTDPDGWRPDFDWFVKPETVGKILEGKYDWAKAKAEPEQVVCRPLTEEEGERWNPVTGLLDSQ